MSTVPPGSADEPLSHAPDDAQRARGPRTVFVPQLPDLISTAEYPALESKRMIRIRIEVTDQGLSVIADSREPQLVDDLMAKIASGDIESVLCG